MSADYQVTLEWGVAAMRVAAADVIVIADADRGDESAELQRQAPRTSLVLDATLENASAVARGALDEQQRLGARASIAIVAAGERWADGSLRPTAGDLLVAGRVVDELATLGIDFHSPACATACAAAVALRGATKALVAAEARAVQSASGTGAPTASAASAPVRPEGTGAPTASHASDPTTEQTGAAR